MKTSTKINVNDEKRQRAIRANWGQKRERASEYLPYNPKNGSHIEYYAAFT